MTRPLRTNRSCGPRSLTRTTTDFPLERLVTRMRRPNWTPNIAQVIALSLKISLFAVRKLTPGDLFEYQEAFPVRLNFVILGMAVTFWSFGFGRTVMIAARKII